MLTLDETPFTLEIKANYPTFIEGTSTLGLVVVKPYKTCPDGSRIPSDQECKPTGIPGLEVVLTLAVLGSVAVIYAVGRRRRE
ncbi:MAG: hypothetical protein AM326_11950 [Candidatus Thorarchaeota archaeon SMTZ-45]|nr:MAG: hypothetical protein AM326_11950 [Candidatus Thorarchaeota archaeon SMTZ-45]